MGFWSNLLSSISRDSGSMVFTPHETYLGAQEFGAWAATVDGVSKLTPAQMWATQPHFRTVVTFIARNVAQLGLHTFERVTDSDRRRDRDSVLAQSLADVDGQMTTYELVFSLVGDLALYDRAYWWVAPSSLMPSGWMIRRFPPTWVEPKMANPWEVKEYHVYNVSSSGFVTVPADRMLAFTGYNPSKMHGASPTVDALRDTLQEQVEAAVYRAQVWKRGGRVSAVLQRPKDAPEWSPHAREQFREDWYAKYTGRGEKAGGTPILEDGMTLNRVDFTAQEQQFVEAAKLSLVTVASAFHVNPTMIGQNDGANYSNVREFRKMLYGETLGPLLAQIESRINSFLIPKLGLDRSRFYVEFNIAEKLQGNFEEQAAVISTSVGRPWMTADEARARFNMPALGGDAAQLVTPLNVLVGGQASPRDSGSQNRNNGRALTKAGPTDAQRDKVAEVLAAFFARQGKSVLSALGSGGEWWDEERWDAELADDLHRVAFTLAGVIGKAEAERLGFSDDFDPDLTVEYLRAVAERYASNINATTKAQLDATLESDDPDPAGVFTQAEGSRAAGVAVGVGTFLAGFASTEAAQQIARTQGVEPTKTWVTGPNARASHAALNGETVPFDGVFSNGMKWPGDATGGVDEVAGCNCTLVITIP